MIKRTVNFKIYRYDPDKDEKPYMQDISVELEASDKKLLDALVRLRARRGHADRGFDHCAHRCSCARSVCLWAGLGKARVRTCAPSAGRSRP